MKDLLFFYQGSMSYTGLEQQQGRPVRGGVYTIKQGPCANEWVSHLCKEHAVSMLCPVCLSVRPFASPSIYLTIDLPIYQPIRPPIYLSIYLPIILSVYLPIYQVSTYLPTCQTYLSKDDLSLDLGM